MTAREIVSNSGPLISLEKLPDGFAFIRKLYDKILVPPEVLAEVSIHYESPQAYIQAFGLTDLLEVKSTRTDPAIPSEGLHTAEVKAMSLAIRLQYHLLIEEKAAREIARKLLLPVSGIGGQILKASTLGVISKAEALSKLTVLYDAYRINRKIYAALTDKIRAS
jgi:predicted nucleic acid-binding protein